MAQQLLICVVNDPAKVPEILEAFLDIGVTGATVLDSHGMGTVLTREAPIFAGFQKLLGSPTASNKTIFSVIDGEETLQAAIRAIEVICGRFEDRATGLLFTVPVTFSRGLSPEIT
jgi:hypothetical protein